MVFVKSCNVILFLFQYYEALLVEARSKMESSMTEAVEKAAASEMQDIQNELEKWTEERNAIAEVTYPFSIAFGLLFN